MRTLHLGVMNEGSDMGGRTWDCVCDVLAKIRCPCDPGIGICAQLCIYAFRIVCIVVYDMGGCHMSVVINPGAVNCFCGCVMDFMMFLAYFWDNNQDIITHETPCTICQSYAEHVVDMLKGETVSIPHQWTASAFCSTLPQSIAIIEDDVTVEADHKCKWFQDHYDKGAQRARSSNEKNSSEMFCW